MPKTLKNLYDFLKYNLEYQVSPSLSFHKGYIEEAEYNLRTHYLYLPFIQFRWYRCINYKTKGKPCTS